MTSVMPTIYLNAQIASAVRATGTLALTLALTPSADPGEFSGLWVVVQQRPKAL
jgi:hypothetical protein